MDRMIYIAMTGAKQTMLAQAVNSNNMANANTTGFKADLMSFRSVPVNGPGGEGRVYALADTPGVDTTSGKINSTGRELDIAVSGKGWFAVQAPDGSEAYTRAGNLHIAEGGILKTGSGLSILGNGGPISLPQSEKVEIGGDGTISIQGIGQAPSALTVIDRIKLVKPDETQLTKSADGLLHLRDGSISQPDASVGLISGVLETSNVSAIDAMVNMIALARQFETQVKMMKTAEEMDDTATKQLLSV